MSNGQSTTKLVPQSSSITGSIAQANNLIALPGTSDERRYFDYFRHRIPEAFSGCFTSEFWDRLVLQVSRDDSAVWHAVIALASMHESASLETKASHLRPLGLSYSTEQYTKALSCLQKRIASCDARDAEVALTCCIVFIVFESMQGNHDSAILHFKSGLRILSQAHASADSTATTSHPIRDDLMPVFLRMNIQARSLLRPVLPEYHELMNRQFPEVPDNFTDLTQAGDSLYNLFNAGFSIFQGDKFSVAPPLSTDVLKPASPTTRVANELARLGELVSRWHTVFTALLEQRGPTLSTRELKGAMLLKIHHICAVVALNTCTYTDNDPFDAFTTHFEQLVSLSKCLIEATGWATTPSFTIDMGIIAPLYFTATSCRDPVIRRQALHLLENLPRQEGAWDATTAAQIAAWIISVEEQAVGQVKTASDVPARSRVRSFHAEVLVPEKKIRLIPKFGGANDDEDDGNDFRYRGVRDLCVDWNKAWNWRSMSRVKIWPLGMARPKLAVHLDS
ncbi:MAG: hypothetical protein Q9217_006155 [Psora testacea]